MRLAAPIDYLTLAIHGVSTNADQLRHFSVGGGLLDDR